MMQLENQPAPVLLTAEAVTQIPATVMRNLDTCASTLARTSILKRWVEAPFRLHSSPTLVACTRDDLTDLRPSVPSGAPTATTSVVQSMMPLFPTFLITLLSLSIWTRWRRNARSTFPRLLARSSTPLKSLLFFRVLLLPPRQLPLH